ncbi:uncharacterized protein VP01_3778g5, partial [Puccinia sorghi]
MSSPIRILQYHIPPCDTFMKFPIKLSTRFISYDGILGMPWLRSNGHLIDWANRCFIPPAAAV